VEVVLASVAADCDAFAVLSAFPSIVSAAFLTTFSAAFCLILSLSDQN